MTEHRAIAKTRLWLEHTVIGLGLCPFAAKPVALGRLAYYVCDASETDEIYRCVMQSLEQFLLADPGEQETALVLLPNGLVSFPDYLVMLDALEAAIDEGGFAGVVQVASFHPDYFFADSAPDDPANYSNRSPVPMFHFIREELLGQVLDGFEGAEEIPVRNVEKLRGMGTQRLRALLENASKD